MSRHLVVNPIACDGHGLCAELLPELVRLDDWGYPMIDPRPHSRRAGGPCPAGGQGLSHPGLDGPGAGRGAVSAAVTGRLGGQAGATGPMPMNDTTQARATAHTPLG